MVNYVVVVVAAAVDVAVVVTHFGMDRILSKFYSAQERLTYAPEPSNLHSDIGTSVFAGNTPHYMLATRMLLSHIAK